MGLSRSGYNKFFVAISKYKYLVLIIRSFITLVAESRDPLNRTTLYM